MALVTKNLTTNIGGIGMGGPKMHSYASADDALATIATSGYFNAAQSQLDTGDMMYVYGNNGVKLYKVVNTAGVITLPIGIAFA